MTKLETTGHETKVQKLDRKLLNTQLKDLDTNELAAEPFLTDTARETVNYVLANIEGTPLANMDKYTLNLFAETWAVYCLASENVNRLGMMDKTGKPTAWFNLQYKTSQQSLKLLKELGMTPLSRLTKVSRQIKQRETADPFAELLND